MSDPAQTDGTLSKRGSQLAGPNTDRFEVRATASDHFAWLRTRASLERTMMSWIRTAVSLIGFWLSRSSSSSSACQGASRGQCCPFIQPRRGTLGLVRWIACGIMALVVSVWQYHWTLHYLWSGSFAALAGMTKEGLQTPLYAVTFALILIGVFAFGAVLLRFV